MLKIRKTENIRNIFITIGTIIIIGFFVQFLNYLTSIISIFVKFKKDNSFYLSVKELLLICNLVIPAGLTLLLMVIYTFIMIFMYFKGKFDKLKIEIIEIDRNGNEESSIYSPFNIYTLILMGIPFFWIILSPIFAGLFIWCCTLNKQLDTLFLVTFTSLAGAILFIVFISSIIAILCSCNCNSNTRRRFPSNYYPNIATDLNNNYFVHYSK